MKNLYDFLDNVRLRPAMFLGEYSISALYHTINGYRIACGINNIEENCEPDLNLLNEYVANYYLRSESSAGWKNIILAENYGNEENALNQFWNIYDDFKTNPKLKNEKQIVFKILEKFIKTKKSEIPIENLDKLTEIFEDLAIKISEIKFSFEYQELIEFLNEEAETNKELTKILEDVKLGN